MIKFRTILVCGSILLGATIYSGFHIEGKINSQPASVYAGNSALQTVSGDVIVATGDAIHVATGPVIEVVTGPAIEVATPTPTPAPVEDITPLPVKTPAPTAAPKKPSVKYYGKKVKVWTKTIVHVRKAASKKSKSIDVIVRGTKLTRLGVSKKGWAKVKYHNKVRYIYNKYLTKKKIKKARSIAGGLEPTYTNKQFRLLGVVYYGGKRWTWYSQRILPGGGLDIPGRHLDYNGYVCDKDNYICLASNDLQKGTIINTPFGKQGKIYDCGCESGTIDTYVGW